MPPRRTARNKAPEDPTPAPITNVFATNASSFAPYAESISALGTSRRRITAFGPSTAAPVPPAVTTDTDSGATQFVLRTLYDDEGNAFTVKTLVRDRMAIPIVLDPEEVPQTPTFCMAGARRRTTTSLVSPREHSRSQSHVSQGRSQT